jgi:anti-sigma factor RsiW
MNCHSFINVQDLHAEGRLSARRARSAERHLAACAACRALAAPAAAPGARAPESLKTKLRDAAKAAPAAFPPAASSGASLPLWPSEARGIALAAALLIAVGLLVSATGVSSQSSGPAVAAVEEP